MKKSRNRVSGQSGVSSTPHPSVALPTRRFTGAKALVGLAPILFYAVPLLSPRASIQWDAADVHYACQAYFARELKEGRLPFWTPYVFSGFPFLADPQVGAFYPLNWPFVLAGAGPKLIQAEIALHGLVAAVGTYHFLKLVIGDVWAAALGAIAYPLSGFFAGHASHVGMVQGASLLPWLFYVGSRAFGGHFLRWLGASGLVAGLILLTGHFQTALYCLVAFAVYGLLCVIRAPGLLFRYLALLGGSVLLAFAISAVMVLPGLELAGHSLRAAQNFSNSTEGTLEARALVTLLVPDALGVFGGEYIGPGDRTQYYFYGGLILLPLVALGMYFRAGAWMPATLALLAIWFMCGPGGGLYRIAMLIPWMGKVRAPIHAWFVAGFAFAWLAAAGVAGLRKRLRAPWLSWGLCVLLTLDLCWVNSWTNPLAFARESFDVLYKQGAELLRSRVAPLIDPGTRFAAADRLTVFGPMNSPLLVRVETKYGYNPLELWRYAKYREAATVNLRLWDALSVSWMLDQRTGQLVRRPAPLSRAWFPRQIRRVAPGEEEVRALLDLEPAEEAVITRDFATARGGQVLHVETGHRQWLVRYRSKEAGLLVFSLPWFPGWSAHVAGRELPLAPVNLALSGVQVPAGEHVVTLEYRSRWFKAGALLSLTGALSVALLWSTGAAWRASRTLARTRGATGGCAWS